MFGEPLGLAVARPAAACLRFPGVVRLQFATDVAPPSDATHKE